MLTNDENDPLSKPFDLIIIGTSLVESCVAAAASIAGKRVLHIDSATFYGGVDATLSLKDFDEWLKSGGGNGVTPLKLGGGSVSAVIESATISGSGGRGGRCYVDIFPSLTLARGIAVDTLVAAGAASHLEFRCAEGAFVADSGGISGSGSGSGSDSGGIMRVPAGKRDVFDAPNLTLIERRALGRFLQSVADDATTAMTVTSTSTSSLSTLNERELGTSRSLRRPQNKALPITTATMAQAVSITDMRGGASQELQQVVDIPWSDKLTAAGLPFRLSTLIRSAVALESDRAPPLTALEGRARTASYAASTQRFGISAFLLPLHGAGELPQALCRVAAVHGAVYMLGTSPERWIKSNDGIGYDFFLKDIETPIKTHSVLISSASSLSPLLEIASISDNSNVVDDDGEGDDVTVVIVVISEKSLHSLLSTKLGILTLPFINGRRGATLVQQYSSTAATPCDLTISHLFTTAKRKKGDDVNIAVVELFERAQEFWDFTTTTTATTSQNEEGIDDNKMNNRPHALWYTSYSILRRQEGAGVRIDRRSTSSDNNGIVVKTDDEGSILITPSILLSSSNTTTATPNAMWRNCGLHNENIFLTAKKTFSDIFPTLPYFTTTTTDTTDTKSLEEQHQIDTEAEDTPVVSGGIENVASEITVPSSTTTTASSSSVADLLAALVDD